MNTTARIWDLRGTDFLDAPEKQLRQMRADGPLAKVKVPLLGTMWMTTTDAGARALLKDTQNFSRDPTRAGKKSMDRLMWWMPRFMAPLMKSIIMADGAEHKRLRKLVDHAFARAEIEELRPDITQTAQVLLADLPPDRPVDIVAHFTHKLPVLVICALLGIPDDHRQKISRWISPISGPTNALSMLRAMPGLRKIIRHFKADFEVVRKTGRPGLIHELVMAESDGDTLSEEELLSMVFILFVAGHETTVHLINDTILAMIERPEIAPRLAAHPEELGLLIEESMRYFSPVMLTKPHFAVQDTDFQGVKVKRGDMLSALLISANHDDDRFEAPDEFLRLRRPNAHVGFGFGPHVCLGMQLARVETQVAVSTLFQRFPELALAHPSAPVNWTKRTGMRGPKTLPLILGPAAKTAH